jgi:hypothetical protein
MVNWRRSPPAWLDLTQVLLVAVAVFFNYNIHVQVRLFVRFSIA